MAVHEFEAGAAVFVSLAGVVAAVGVAAAAVAWRRGMLGIKESVAVVGAALAGAFLLILLAPSPEREPALPSPPPGAFAQRANALLSQAMSPNSPLACVDAVAGDQVKAACEAILFGRPETIAAAVSYVTAKVMLLSQGVAQQQNGNAKDPALALLQQNLAADRFGIVAHVLATTAGCSAERCDALALMEDSSQIAANLRDGTFDRLVEKHMPNWPAAGDHPPGGSAADAAPKAATGSQPGKPTSSHYDFPSAASIPPISIMVPEEPRGGKDQGRPAAAPKRVPKPRPAAAAPAAAPASAKPVAASPASPRSGTASGPARAE